MISLLTNNECRCCVYRFVDSEFNLIESIHGLMILSSLPSLTFPLLIENSTLSTLSDLLSHENVEVSIAVIQVLEEYLDQDEEDEVEVDEEVEERTREAVKNLLDEMVKQGVVELVVSGLKRFDEDDEDHRTGVFHTLSKTLHSLYPLSHSPYSLKPPILNRHRFD